MFSVESQMAERGPGVGLKVVGSIKEVGGREKKNPGAAARQPPAKPNCDRIERRASRQ